MVSEFIELRSPLNLWAMNAIALELVGDECDRFALLILKQQTQSLLIYQAQKDIFVL